MTPLRCTALFATLTALALGCVKPEDDGTASGAAGAGSPGAAGSGPAGSGPGGAGGVNVTGTAGATAGVAGASGAAAGSFAGASATGVAGQAGSPAKGGAGGRATGVAGGAGRGGSGPSGGAGGALVEARDHCTYGYPVDPRDAQISNNPDQWTSTSNEVDLVLPAKVLDWMMERVWEKSHDAWHNVRRCMGASSGVCARPELVADHKECADAEDGYQFLVMHRHMMQGLRQAFPQHASLFEGFSKFPYNAADVPQQWQGRWGTGWSQQILDVAKVLEDIENKLSMFPTEGDLGKYIQCGGMSNGASSIHGALHFKWVVNASPHSLGKQTVNIDNYMFWKLHGWIDKIWERYRAAKGLKPDEPKLVAALDSQCREMHRLGLYFDPSIGEDPDKPLPVEAGYFHETVRPIFEKICSGCHSEASPDANMSLGGKISSADVVKNLVNVTTLHGGQFKRIVPNNPTQSWLYLKVAGMAASAGCTGSMCNAQVMPPTGRVTLTTSELDAVKSWINMGAPAPTTK